MIENAQLNNKISSGVRLFDFFLYIYVLLLPIGTGLAGIIGSISLMNYFAVGIAACGVMAGIRKRNFIIKKRLFPTLLYFFYTVISVVWSPDATFNWYVVTNIVNFILLVILNTHQWGTKEIEDINKFVAISQVIVIAAVTRNISSIYNYRLNITIVSTIGISDFACGLCLIIAMWMNVASTTTKKSWRIIAFAAIAADVAIIIMAGSRGALAMVFAMVAVWIFLGKYSGKMKLLIVLVVLGILFFFGNYFIDLLPSTITNRLTLSAIQSSNGSGRFNIWKLAWDTFKSSTVLQVLFGHGFNSFLNVISYGSHGGHQDLLAHNVVIQTMIEGGIVGTVLLAQMIISQLKLAWKNNDNMMKIAVVGLFVASLSIDMQVTRIWGFILALNCIRNRQINYKFQTNQ